MKKYYFRMIAPAFPAFNIYSRVAFYTTALGPVSVATKISEMKTWEVEIIDENNYRKPAPINKHRLPDHSILQTIRPADVVGLYGGLSSTIPRLFELAALYKAKGVITIAGGQHFVEENIQAGLENNIDYIVIGEGENTICDLLNAIKTNQPVDGIKGIAFLKDGKVAKTLKRDPIENFEDLPLPRFELIHYSKIKLFPVSWIRGCGMNCEFCTVKGKPRPSSAERVLKQFSSILENHNGRHFFIIDDLFGHYRSETLRLCRMLEEYQKAVRIKFDIAVQIRLDKAKDSELLDAMRKANITTVCIGFESPIAEELEAMNKNINTEYMITLARRYRNAGFLVHGMFIFAYPLLGNVSLKLSIEERIRRFRSFIRKAKLDTIQVLLPVPLPGTELTARLKNEKRIFDIKCIGWEYYDGNFPLFIPDKPLTPEEVHYAIHKIMSCFYRFRSMLAVGINVLIFPALFFSLWNISYGWRKWYRGWRNNIVQFGGWLILKRWKSFFAQNNFQSKLDTAKKAIDIIKKEEE